jgi:hypothetical protein
LGIYKELRKIYVLGERRVMGGGCVMRGKGFERGRIGSSKLDPNTQCCHFGYYEYYDIYGILIQVFIGWDG